MRCGRESSFDNIHAETREVVRHFQFFSRGHRRAGGLFTITQSCIKNANIVIHKTPLYFFQFSGRNERTAAPARHISESCITLSSASNFSRYFGSLFLSKTIPVSTPETR